METKELPDQKLQESKDQDDECADLQDHHATNINKSSIIMSSSTEHEESPVIQGQSSSTSSVFESSTTAAEAKDGYKDDGADGDGDLQILKSRTRVEEAEKRQIVLCIESTQVLSSADCCSDGQSIASSDQDKVATESTTGHLQTVEVSCRETTTTDTTSVQLSATVESITQHQDVIDMDTTTDERIVTSSGETRAPNTDLKMITTVANSGSDEQREYEDEDDFDPDSVISESAFWHIESSHENGFESGMRIELIHDEQEELSHTTAAKTIKKYWMAKIVGNFGQLLSLEWNTGTESSDTKNSFFFDLNKRKFYPLGHFRRLDSDDPGVSYIIEPPSCLNLTEDMRQTLITEHQSVEYNDYNRPLALFSSGGLTTDLFTPANDTKIILEVSHEEDPCKIWLAVVVKNVGGRLLLKWITSSGTTDATDHNGAFWLYFSHPRVNCLGAGKVSPGVTYEPVVVFDGWKHYLEDVLSQPSTERDTLRKYMMDRCKSCRPDLIDATQLSSMNENEKLLLFPSNLLKLVTGSIESKSGINMKIKGVLEDHQIGFNYPSDDKNAILPYNWADENEIPVEYPSSEYDNWSQYVKSGLKSKAASFRIKSNTDRMKEFKINGKIEVVHPDDPNRICEAVIIRVTSPLIWSQVSEERICVLPFNSTDMYPTGWTENNDYPLSQLLPSKSKSSSSVEKMDQQETNADAIKPTEPNDSSIPSGVSSSAWCQRIYFNHKCFTGPSLSKSKLCNLPRFVGPGPVLLVLQEVISKILSIAYVSSRILNDLASESFIELLEENEIKRTEPVMFKAKYNNSNKTSRLNIPVIRSGEKVEDYCRLMCSHLKCCFNLFGPNLYDGDHCPSNCRGLTKSNKVLKKAAYYREQAAAAKIILPSDKSCGGKTSPPDMNKISGGKKKKKSPVDDEDSRSNSSASDVKKIKKSDANDDDEVIQIKNSSTAADGDSDNTQDMVISADLDTDSQDKLMDASGANSAVDAAQDDMTSTDRRTESQNSKGSSSTFGPELLSTKNANAKSYQESRRNFNNSSHPHPVRHSWTSCNVPMTLDNPLRWTVAGVYNFLMKTECASLASFLRNNEIDGAALMLLDHETISSNVVTGYTLKFTERDVENLIRLINRLRIIWSRSHHSQAA